MQAFLFNFNFLCLKYECRSDTENLMRDEK